MKNKKGFTMVELLAVITILGIITTIATLSVTHVIKKNREKALEAKEKIILKQAVQYAKDNDNLLYNSNKRYGNYVCTTITVNDLVEAKYIDADDNDTTSGIKDVVNPVNGESMKDRKIMLYIKSKEDPTSQGYNTVGIYNGSIISSFNYNLCAAPSGSDIDAINIFYDNFYTHVDCDNVQCMLDHIAGMLNH